MTAVIKIDDGQIELDTARTDQLQRVVDVVHLLFSNLNHATDLMDVEECVCAAIVSC